MSSALGRSIDNIVIYNGYPLSVVVAVSFHCVLLGFLLYLQTNRTPEALELIQPTVIKALLIEENPQVVNQQNVERQRLERIEQQRVTREREQRQAAEAEAQRQAEAEAARVREAQQQREREQAALIERQELERQQAERLKREQEQRDNAERQRQREVAEAERVRQQQQQQQQDQARQQQADAQQAAQAEAARTEFELVQSATALIQQVVQENWSRPPSARNGMRAILQIRMLPTGELVDATITQSSGDAAFDRSAETAVFRAAPFRELASLPITIFNANFRTLSLIFEPEDLLN